MKSNKFRLSVLFSLSVITVCVLFVSCENFFMPESKIVKAPLNYINPSLGRKAELALWHTAESFETSVETLQEQIQAWLQPEAENASRSRSSVTSVYSYSITKENGFSSVPADRRSPDARSERSVIPFNVFQLENRSEGTSGFAFTCGIN